MWKIFRKVDRFLDRQVPLLILLAFLLLLRIPNLVEPSWYGDETIYLTIGNAMHQGERLYSQIVDHKTPIIYYLAMVPDQFWFRVLNISCMVLATIIFYQFAKKLFRSSWLSYLISFGFVIFTSLPGLEGNIPNGELFVIFFVLLGVSILSKTRYFQDFFENEKSQTSQLHLRFISEQVLLLISGIFFGIGILTKVPGIFDLFGFLSIGWFSLLRLPAPLKQLTASVRWPKHELDTIKSTFLLGLGSLVPILGSIIYFAVRGSGQAYLDYGLLYNFHYADAWKLNFTNPLLTFSFSLVGKTLIVAVFIICLTIASCYLSRRFQFILSWFSLALFATLLSSRPYPHYFLQLVPPACLLAGELLAMCGSLVRRSRTKTNKLLELSFMTVLVIGVVGVVQLLQLRPYPTIEYYQRFYKLLTNQITQTQYRDSFESLMPDNYTASAIIAKAPGRQLFIWGTDPGIYALSKKIPVGRFTVLFHIQDFHAEHETYLDFVKVAPEYAIVMKGSNPTPEINQFLQSHYIPNMNFQHFVLWQKIPS